MSQNSLALDRETITTDVGQFAPEPDWDGMGESEHFVQFYEQDACLVESVSAFFATGLRRGQTAILIATQTHRDHLEDYLIKDGLNVESLRLSGHYVPLDAAETLAKFMVNGSADRQRFIEVVGSVVERASKTGLGVRAFGEMVALLWAGGNGRAALDLEEFWNDLAKRFSFALFCAYPMDGFRGESNGNPFKHICQAHSRVIPSESYGRPGTTADERLRSITLLQQKAASLELEIAVRKEAEKALARRTRELSDFLETATEGIHQIGPDGKILWANKAELEMLGYTAGEYIGHDISEFHADAEVIADILTRLKQGESLHDYEARVKHKNGSVLHVSINSNGYWQEGKFAHTRCFTRDITERKRAAEILEKMVVERTAQLQETITELEAFSYSISHDMRSPLRAMHAYATALLEDYRSKLDTEAVDHLERIQRAATRMDILIRDVLAYSKVSKGDLELKPVALNPLVQDILEQHPGLESVKECIVVEELHAVIGHEAYLTQCFANLLDNAVKFVIPGTAPKVQIRSEVVQDQVRICVVDHGIGIHPDHNARIFQIFGRVHSEKSYGGTGIGLAIVSKAVARMGGQVGFDSEVGRGSTFWFTLRRAAHV